MANILVTGGAGFIGSNFVHHILDTYSDYRVVNYDKLTYAGNLNNLSRIIADGQKNARYTFVQGDICDVPLLHKTIEKHNITHIINFAAETHVDRSIHGDCTEFVMANTFGVLHILNSVKKYDIEKFVNVSTDEVYGSLALDDNTFFTEETPIEPNMPYAAAKAGGDLLCRAYCAVHKLPVVVTHCSNNYGPYQYPEKLIPISLFRLLKNKKITIHGNGQNVRDWIHVKDHCAALDLMLHKGKSGEIYNVGVDNERSNLDIAKMILALMDKSENMIEFVADRPANDLRYAIDASKIERLGWKPKYTKEKFDIGLSETINWYLTNKDWVEDLWAKHEEAHAINHTPERIQKTKNRVDKDERLGINNTVCYNSGNIK
ncbi:MAG: dTDP-glucose 4,6-dehydratase [Candidatus Magasanikbacteria bacterium]|nr:dTDP-glucose 4,6-dehydratase [Candidatus Magasanikbacteria bacterium]|tara:strand:- start:3504 stop:4628 length:1125 start_codon:yes stop_codon:yes gene_type:complete